MTKIKVVLMGLSCVAIVVTVFQEASKHDPITFASDCAGGDCPLLMGPPQTSGMRGGSAERKPGESVGWHSDCSE
jgi:hypothetical protein